MKLTNATTLLAFVWASVPAVLLWAPSILATGDTDEENYIQPEMTGVPSLVKGDASVGGEWDAEKLVELQATSDAVSAMAIDSLKSEDVGARVNAFEGNMEKLEGIADELQGMDRTGSPHFDGPLQALATHLEKFMHVAPDVLGFMRDRQAVQENEKATTDLGKLKTSEKVDAIVASSFRGRTKQLAGKVEDGTPGGSRGQGEHGYVKINHEESDGDGAMVGTDSDVKRRLSKHEDVAKNPSSKEKHRSLHREYAKRHSAHRFENAHAAHKHEQLNRLEDAVMGGDHDHIGKVLSSVRSKVDGKSGILGGGHGRRLTTEEDKAQQCYQLTKCAKDMSFYDTMMFFYSDDIDPTDGEIDGSIQHFDDENLEAKHDLIKSTANDLYMIGGDDPAGYTDSSVAAIKVWSDPSKCMNVRETATNNVQFFPCTQDTNQQFEYDPIAMTIKSPEWGCLTVRPDVGYSVNANLECDGGSEQRWYMTADNELKSEYSEDCLEWTGVYVALRSCTGEKNQKFTAPKGYDPTKYTSPAVSTIKVWADDELCMDKNTNDGNIYMGQCHNGNNQLFRYDPQTEEIKVMSDEDGENCLDYDPAAETKNVKIHSCHGGDHQKWHLNNKNQIVNKKDGHCLDMVNDENSNSYGELIVFQCHDGENQRFFSSIFLHPYVAIKDDSSRGIVNLKTDKSICMSMYSMHKNSDNFRNVRMVDCHYGNNQQWLFNPLTQAIESPGNGCLGYDSATKNVWVAPCNGSKYQQWYMNSWNQLKNKNNNKCLDLDRSDEMHNLYLNDCHRGDNQQFSTTPFDFFSPTSKTSKCDDLLRLFYRNVEFDGVGHWEGGTVSQVCLAEGSQTFVKLDDIAIKIGSYYAKKVADEIFECSQDLQNSYVSPGHPFPFSTDDRMNENTKLVRHAGSFGAYVYNAADLDYKSLNGIDLVPENMVDNDNDSNKTYWRVGDVEGTTTYVTFAFAERRRIDKMTVQWGPNNKPSRYLIQAKVADEWGFRNVFDSTWTDKFTTSTRTIQFWNGNEGLGNGSLEQHDIWLNGMPTVPQYVRLKLLGSEGPGGGYVIHDVGFYMKEYHNGASSLVIPTGYNMANRDKYGMIVDVTEPVYDMENSNAHSNFASAALEAEDLYREFWEAMRNQQYRGELFEPGAAAPIGLYSGDSAWKNKYFRADRLIKILQYLDNDEAPPGPTGASQLNKMWEVVDTKKGTASRSEYAEYLLDKYTSEIQGRFKAMQHAYDLVLGDKTSVGFICGVKEAVTKHGPEMWPGTCCLSAPFQNDGDDWGRTHDCTKPCHHPGPFFAGIHEESCSAHGGTWCAKPTDCSTLKTCLQDAYLNANSNGRAAFASYLAPGLVGDPTDAEDCGSSLEYFGFDARYTHHEDVCENVLQLHNTRNFEFLDQFYAQGSDEPAGVGSSSGSDEVGQHTWENLSPPDRSTSTSDVVVSSPAWGATNFALSQTVDGIKSLVDFWASIKCPGLAILEEKCKIMSNFMYKFTAIAYGLSKLALDISVFTMDFTAGEFFNQVHATHEDAAVLFENTEAINKNLKAVYDDVTTLNGNLDSTKNDLLDAINQKFLIDGDTVVTLPEVRDELLDTITSQCGVRRGLQVEDEAAGEVLVVSTKLDEQQKQIDDMNVKLEMQNVKMDQQMEQINLLSTMLKELLGQQQHAMNG